MFHLCNVHDPELHISRSNLKDLLTLDNDSARVFNRGPYSHRQLVEWLKATITEENYEDFLYWKIASHCAYGEERAIRSSHWFKMFKKILAGKPKWLLEYLVIDLGSRSSCAFYGFIPQGRTNGSDNWVNWDTIVINFTYDNFPSRGDFAGFYHNDPVIADSTIEQMRAHLDEIERAFTTFLEHDAAQRLYIYDDLARTSLKNALIRSLFAWVCDRGVIVTRQFGTIRPTQALERINALEEDKRSRVTIEINEEHMLYNDRAVITLTLPRAPATREALSTILNYTTNVLDMLPFTMRGGKEQHAPLYGIELEACSNYSPTDIIRAQDELFFIMKQDGSISGVGRHKYEMVTVPATYKVHKRLWAEFFNKVDYREFDVSTNTGNGMHVHIDRKAFKTEQHLNRFTWFMINPANSDFLFELSERPNKNDFSRWAPLPTFGQGASKAKTMRQAVNHNRNLRGAVHFKGNSTVEIRMFKGVVSYATILKNLEFVDSLFHFSLETALTNITLGSYLTWLSSQPQNRYSALRAFIAEFKNLENIQLSNQLKEYLFAENRPEYVIDKLRKAKFPITNKHLTMLNREKRKRTYVLDKEGIVQLAYATGGKLAKLDKMLQDKMTRGKSQIHVSLV